MIKGHGYRFNGRIEDFEREVGGGQGSGNGDLDAAQIAGRELAAGDDHGAVALADAAAAAHQRVVLLQIGIGVKADGRDVKESLVLGAAVEGFDVAKRVGKAIAGNADLVGGQAIKHECVVGVGTMRDRDIDRCGGVAYSGLRVTHSGKVLSRRKTAALHWMRLDRWPAQRLEAGGRHGGRGQQQGKFPCASGLL
jgi:hypothetical protein